MSCSGAGWRAGARRIAAGALALGVAGSAWSDEQPLWELGAGVSVLHFPAYRGSEETRQWALPLPYVVYRGEFLKADRRGLRGLFLDTERAELSLSLAASPPASSKDVDVRDGMPDLEPTVELGPSLDLHLWRQRDTERRLTLRLPLRHGITVERHPRSTGWQFTPNLNLDWSDPPGLDGWRLGLLGGPVFGDRRQHRYFYGVAPEHATAQRPAYEARGGYAGMQFLASLSKRYPTYWVGGFVRYDTLAHATFADSPLVTSRRYLAAGVAVTWIFGESSQRVWTDE